MVTSRVGRPAPLLIMALLVALTACSEPTGLPQDPSALQEGTFRAEVSGSRTESLRGDAHNHFAKSLVTRKRLWQVTLGAPPGAGRDSVSMEFRLQHTAEGLPAPGTYRILPYRGELRYSRDSVWIGLDFDPGPLFFAQSGTLTLTEAVVDGSVAGRFEFSARAMVDDTLGEQRISVSGAFHAGAP